jgi:hypothetical protein
MKTSFRLLLVLTACCASASSTFAWSTTLSAEDSGFYNAVGRHSKLDGSPDYGMATPATFNYSIGTIDDGPPFGPPGTLPDVFRKNFFTFDLSSISSGSIVGAALKLFLPPTGYSNMLSPSVTFKLYGTIVASNAAMDALSAELKAVHPPHLPAEYTLATNLFSRIGNTKLAAIPAFGTAVVTPAAAGTMIVIPLTPTGIAYLNLYGGGDIVLGGELDGLSTAGPPDEPPVFLFGFTSPVSPGTVSWDMSSVTPTPTPELELVLIDPILTIAPSAPDEVLLSWTPATPGFVLQETLSLTPASWTNSSSGATNPVTHSTIGLTEKFYRLHKP